MGNPFRDLSAKAVLIGGVVDIVATNILAVPLVIIFLAGHGAERSGTLTQNLFGDSTFYLAGLALGCAASALGGWTAARLARRGKLLNGSLSAFACVGLGIYEMISHQDSAPLWQQVALFVLSPALGASGALIRIRQERSISPAPPPSPQTGPITSAPQLHGGARWIFMANAALATVSAVVLLFFGLVGLYGYSRHDQNVIVGSVLLSAFGAGASVLFFLGRRALRAGRPRHWALNAGGLLLTLIPIALLLLGMALSRNRGG